MLLKLTQRNGSLNHPPQAPGAGQFPTAAGVDAALQKARRAAELQAQIQARLTNLATTGLPPPLIPGLQGPPPPGVPLPKTGSQPLARYAFSPLVFFLNCVYLLLGIVFLFFYFISFLGGTFVYCFIINEWSLSKPVLDIYFTLNCFKGRILVKEMYVIDRNYLNVSGINRKLFGFI